MNSLKKGFNHVSSVRKFIVPFPNIAHSRLVLPKAKTAFLQGPRTEKGDCKHENEMNPTVNTVIHGTIWTSPNILYLGSAVDLGAPRSRGGAALREARTSDHAKHSSHLISRHAGT